MAEDYLEFTARMNHCLRDGYFNSTKIIAEEALRKNPNESVYKFYYAIGLLFEKKNSEALRELDPLQNDIKVSLGSCLAASVAHRSCVNIDREELASVETRIKEGRKSSSPDTYYFAGLFLYFSGKIDKAKEYIDRVIKLSNKEFLDATSLRGWIEIKLDPKDKGPKDPSDYFENVLRMNRKHFDAILGLAHFCEISHEFDIGVEKLNELLAFSPNWWPALIEKMKLTLCLQDWDQTLDIAVRVANTTDSVEAQRFKILYSLCREGNMKECNRLLELFLKYLKRFEPNNVACFIDNAKLFSQLAGYDEGILNLSLKLARMATELEIDNPEYIAEVGKILLLIGNQKEAFHEFKLATSMDNSSIPALYGMITCQIAEGNIGDIASQQLEFLRQLATDNPAELCYLTAIMAKFKNQPSQTILSLLNDSLDAHFRHMRGLPFNLLYLKAIKPNLVLNIVKEYLLFAPQEPVMSGMSAPIAVRQAMMILDTVLKVCPYHREALYISAQTKYLSGDFRTASGILTQILNMDSSQMEAHLLKTQVHLATEDFSEAEQILENALSSNFKIRELPKYHLLISKVQRQKGEMDKALVSLQTAMANVKNHQKESSEKEKGAIEFSLADKLSLYMDLVLVLHSLGKEEEANNLIEEALIEFKGTFLEGRISLTQAEDLIEKGDFETALNILRAVQPDQSHFVEAKKMMADIFLKNKRDNKLYIVSYQDIVNQNPSPQNLLLLGDAYMSIQEPDKAIETFELALSKNPKDATLASKMGQALIKTHNFTRAINYYKEAIKSDDNFNLRYDLASLHLRLKQWDKAEKTVQQALNEKRDNSLSGVIAEVKLLVLLAKSQEGASNISKAMQSLIRAKDCQNRVIKRALLEQPSIIDDQKAEFAHICRLIGEMPPDKTNEIDYSIRCVKEALEILPNDIQCLTTLSKLYMKSGDHIHCQQTCQKLLSIKSDSMEASSMLGELFLRKFDFQTASFHFQQFLETNPTHWNSLIWYIDCARRCGILNEAVPYLKNAESRCDQNNPGFGYCKGLFEWYNGNANSALKMLNKARKDPIFGARAIFLMIDIYLNPTGSLLGGEALESTTTENKKDAIPNGNTDKAELREVSIKTAEMLLWDMPKGEDKFKRQILECFILLATKNKNRMEKAVQELSGLVTTEAGRESIMLCYALATGYMLIKQTPRARNQLKRMLKANWTLEDAEHLERCWLLLADIYVQSSKFDLATDLIKKVLLYNKSCSKASEYLGFIMEKEQAHADAAVNYEQAWKMSNYTNPALGYKLGFNYLKAKRYTDAIDVCHTVLSKNPNYPRIKKDILDKARANLRA